MRKKSNISKWARRLSELQHLKPGGSDLLLINEYWGLLSQRFEESDGDVVRSLHLFGGQLDGIDHSFVSYETAEQCAVAVSNFEDFPFFIANMHETRWTTVLL